MSSGDSILPAPASAILAPEVITELHRIEGDNFIKEEQVQTAFVDQHFSGNLAPREAHRVRSELIALLQMVSGNNGNSQNNGASLLPQPNGSSEDAATAARGADDQKELFDVQLRAFDQDLELLIEGTSRALRRRVGGGAASAGKVSEN